MKFLATLEFHRCPRPWMIDLRVIAPWLIAAIALGSPACTSLRPPAASSPPPTATLPTPAPPLVSPQALPSPTPSPSPKASPAASPASPGSSPRPTPQGSPVAKAATPQPTPTGPLTVEQLLQRWPRYAPPKGNFSIAFPAPPTEATEQIATQPQPTTLVVARHQDAEAGRFLLVAYNVIPRSQRSAIDPAKALDSSRDRLVQSLNAKLVSEAPLRQNGYAGRDLVLHRPGAYVAKVRLVYAQGRLYQAIAGVSDGNLARPDVQAFFQSWQLAK